MSVHYGRIQALHSISLNVDEGEIVTLHRRQRRRQDDHHAGDLGFAHSEQRQDQV